MVAINSLTMLVLYGVLGDLLLGIGRLPVPWQALVLYQWPYSLTHMRPFPQTD